MRVPPVIALTKASKVYSGDKPAVDELTLEIKAGKLTAIIGPSGSGKSTTLRMLNGLVAVTSGEVSVLGSRLDGKQTEAQLKDLRSQIGFIFQDFGLSQRLTALENVLIGSLSKVKGPKIGIRSYPQELRTQAMAELDRVGLAEFAFRRVDQLSGGQMQRVAIARALMQNPKILIADEPVASLDPTSSHEVMTILKSIASQDAVTVVVSLHQIELAMEWADRIVGIKLGKLVFDSAEQKLTEKQIKAIYAR